MNWELRGSNLPSAFITGSTRGIGREIARQLVADGWSVAIHGRELADATAVAQELGESAIPFGCDLTNTEALGAALFDFSKRNEGLDALIHSAGIMKDAPLGLLSDELVSEVMEVNAMSTLKIVQLSSRIMGRRKSGAIVLINSVVGLDGAPGQTLYSMSKSALTGLVASAAKELGPRGIRINAIAPGLIHTDLISGLSDEVILKQTQRIPLGRIGTPTDVAPLVAFLVSDGSRYITGQTIRIDGGYSV